MPLQNKRSDTPGARANIIPGEVGHNRADRKLLIRGDGRKLEIDLDKLQRLAPYKEGFKGAPLSVQDEVVVWDTSLVPPGIADDGRTQVDAPPEAWGLPGFHPFDKSTAEVAADGVRVEAFYIASDSIIMSDVMVNLELGEGGALRVGIFDDLGSSWMDELVEETVSGINVIPSSVILPRGAYRVMVWSSDDIEVTTVEGRVYSQSFTVDMDDAPKFTRYESAEGSFLEGLILAGLPTTDEEGDTPGVSRAVLFSWTLP